MANEWLAKTLGDVVRLQRGHDLPEPKRQVGDVPVMGSFGITGWHNEAIEQGTGVTVGRSGASIGVVSYIDRPYWPLNTCLYVTDFMGNDPRFCYYWLKEQDLVAFNSGSAQPSLNRNYVYLKQVIFPSSVEEQRAIAHILGTLDDKIELNRKRNETLEAMARALFQSWFVDFGPVRAKAEGRDPGLPADIAALFPDSFEPSELGDVPKGWKRTPFSDTVEIIGGGTPKTSVAEYWDGNIPWFSVVDAPNTSDIWAIDTEKRITRAGVDNSSTKILPEGTTIISARGTVGRLALTGAPMAMNQSCYGLRGQFGARGTYTYFATREVVSLLQRGAHGSVFDTITRESFQRVQIPLVPAPVVDAFENLVEPFLVQMRSTLFQSRTLAALRDTLLPKLISGELRIGSRSASCAGRAS